MLHVVHFMFLIQVEKNMQIVRSPLTIVMMGLSFGISCEDKPANVYDDVNVEHFKRIENRTLRKKGMNMINVGSWSGLESCVFLQMLSVVAFLISTFHTIVVPNIVIVVR